MRNVFIATTSGLTLLAALHVCGCGSETQPTAAPPDDGSSNLNFGSGGSSGDPSGENALGSCATSSKKAEKVPLDMVIGLDTSFSMDFDNKWANIRAALKTFVKNPAYADLGIGLQFFPIRKQCSVADYAVPAVALALQPQVASPIASALDAQQMAGGTPMVPLLEGLTTYLRANAKPGRKPVIVLATDGVPDDTCLAAGPGERSNTLENAVSAAEEAKTGTPAIGVFVVGVGKELSALDAIGQAGGTGKAVLIDTGANAEAAFLQALDGIRRQAIPCDYTIPETVSDPSKTNVSYTASNGSTQVFSFVGNTDGCAKAPETGWYFDDEQAPKKVILCSAACEAVKKDDLGRIDVVFGCPRVEVR